MTMMYTQPKPPARACDGRCTKCINDLLADSIGPRSVWYRLTAMRIPRCRYCYRTICPAAVSCANACTAGPDDYPEPPNRINHRVLDTPPMTPPPPDR